MVCFVPVEKAKFPAYNEPLRGAPSPTKKGVKGTPTLSMF